MNLGILSRHEEETKLDRQEIVFVYRCVETIIFHAVAHNCLKKQTVTLGPLERIPACQFFEAIDIEPKELRPIFEAGLPARHPQRFRKEIRTFDDLGHFNLSLDSFYEMARILDRKIVVYAQCGRNQEVHWANIGPEEATDEYKRRYTGK